jgi:hypothetical protein
MPYEATCGEWGSRHGDVVDRTGDEVGFRDWNISTKYLPALESRDLPEPWSFSVAACAQIAD